VASRKKEEEKRHLHVGTSPQGDYSGLSVDGCV